MSAFLYIMTVAPVLTQGPQDMNVTSFEALTLECEGHGFPIPNVTWFHNGSVTDNSNYIITSLEEASNHTISSVLTMSMAMVNDSGYYHCNLSSFVSGYEDAMSEVALVLVQGKFLLYAINRIL